jgi:ABC-type glutathione transport system ATPase component
LIADVCFDSFLTIAQLDIEGLNITVTSGAKSGVKAKGKARAEGLEILANASLKLKGGVHYALIGRNGTGKSSEYSRPYRVALGTRGVKLFSFFFHENMISNSRHSNLESCSPEVDTWNSNPDQDFYPPTNGCR